MVLIKAKTSVEVLVARYELTDDCRGAYDSSVASKLGLTNFDMVGQDRPPCLFKMPPHFSKERLSSFGHPASEQNDLTVVKAAQIH
jgi:hypothetical protein